MIQVSLSYSCKEPAYVERVPKDLKVVDLQIWYSLLDLKIGMPSGEKIRFRFSANVLEGWACPMMFS
jgi:hypothetical protein